MKRTLNLYELIFGAFLVLKLAEVSRVAEFSWFWILLPLFANFIHLFFAWTWKTLDLSETARHEVVKHYYSAVMERERKKALKRYERKIKTNLN